MSVFLMIAAALMQTAQPEGLRKLNTKELRTQVRGSTITRGVPPSHPAAAAAPGTPPPAYVPLEREYFRSGGQYGGKWDNYETYGSYLIARDRVCVRPIGEKEACYSILVDGHGQYWMITPTSGGPFRVTIAKIVDPAARPDFPESLTVDGKRYDRLTGVSLQRAVQGKTFCPSAPCSGIDGSVKVFRDDGAYLVFGDRWDDGGRYAIINDVVVTELGDQRDTFAFYRSADGTIRRAFKDRAGIINLMTEFIK
jgi:hypothetical protein